MAEGRFPKPYVESVKKDEAIMVYVPTDKMDIGARTSGLPDSASKGPMSLEHVGGDQGKRGMGKHSRGGL